MLANKETFILFEKENDKILEQSSPIFEDEIDIVKSEQFFNTNSVENLQESIFRLLYFEDYKENFNAYWFEFIETFLISINFELELFYEEEKDCAYNELIMIVRDEEELDKFYLHFSIENDPSTVFYITQNLIQYSENLFELNVGESFYFDEKTKMFYFAEEAYFIKNKNKINLN